LAPLKASGSAEKLAEKAKPMNHGTLSASSDPCFMDYFTELPGGAALLCFVYDTGLLGTCFAGFRFHSSIIFSMSDVLYAYVTSTSIESSGLNTAMDILGPLNAQGPEYGCSGAAKSEAHRLECELVVASRIVHPEVECQTADHYSGDAVAIIKR
jgi:hypothetical protein